VIDTLVVLPFESASLTKPVAQLKNKGVYVTVVDRGLTDTSAQDAYVAGVLAPKPRLGGHLDRVVDHRKVEATDSSFVDLEESLEL
jgi:ABC-type sugar transport system substrate-binding protein